jgi:hypothetical protein
VNDHSWRLAAASALDGLTSGIRINGLGTNSVSFGSTFAHEFDQTEIRCTPPAMSFIGTCTVNYEVDTNEGPANVQGSPGYQLDVTVTPRVVAEPEPVLEDEESWLAEYGPALAAVGVAALVVIVALAAAPETGGASLVLIPAL